MPSRCGHKGLGHKLSEFDPREVELGLEEEKEHFCNLRDRTITVLDHLVEDEHYYTKLLGKLRKNQSSRPRIYEAREIAKNYVKTFKDRDVEYEKRVKFTWPRYLQHVGGGIGLGYDSDKWKKGELGKRDWELFKHVAESENKVFCVKKFFRNEDTGEIIDTIGPIFDTYEWPMPNAFAELALFSEANMKLHTEGTNDVPRFGRGKNDGIVAVAVRHAYLGASKILWSQIDRKKKDEPFLFVYTDDDGVMFLVGGPDIEKDGIVN